MGDAFDPVMTKSSSSSSMDPWGAPSSPPPPYQNPGAQNPGAQDPWAQSPGGQNAWTQNPGAQKPQAAQRTTIIKPNKSPTTAAATGTGSAGLEFKPHTLYSSYKILIELKWITGLLLQYYSPDSNIPNLASCYNFSSITPSILNLLKFKMAVGFL